MSSKYDCVLDALLIMLGRWKLSYTSIITYAGYLWCDIWYQIWPNPSKLQSRTINVLQVWLCSWCTYNHAREIIIWIHLRNNKLCWWCQIWYQRWPNPPKVLSGTINVLQEWLCYWCTFTHARELKIGIQLNNDII